MSTKNPHIVLVVARGEAVRNFLFSDTIITLSKNARVTLISLVDHGEIVEKVKPHVENIISLASYKEHPITIYVRTLTHYAHFRWLWSRAVQYYWGLHDARARTLFQKVKRVLLKSLAFFFANRPALVILTALDRKFSWVLRPTKEFDKLFEDLRPDLVFNCSHIHGPQADLPLRVAKEMGIPTATFVFSWDNLTSRSRIFVPYDHFLMWNEGMKSQLISLYPELNSQQVHVTGTPQFDFHFKKECILSRQEICERIGLDSTRPFILYTTGLDTDFLDEYKFIEAVIECIQEKAIDSNPQLAVRAYVKGTSPQVWALAEKDFPDVVFPPILWDRQWVMPLFEDLSIYTSLLHHCALGINAASTVTLELMALDKPVINIGMEPPGSQLPHFARFARHVDYEHYRPVAASGGVMVARSMDDLRSMICQALTDPEALKEKRKAFMHQMMGQTLDGRAGIRVAEQLIRIAKSSPC